LIERLLEEGFTSTDIASACLAQLQSGEAAPAHPPRAEDYERPERQERGNYQDSRPRMRSDDRRAPRGESRERFERPQRFAERPLRAGAPASGPARLKAVSTPASGAHGLSRHSGATAEVTRPTTDAAVNPEVEKTFSDEEILASVKPEPRKPVGSKPPGKSAPPWKRREHSEEKAVRPPKQSRPPAGDFTRLHMNLGEKMGVVPIDIVNAIAGETGLPGKVVGNVDIRERHLFVDVATDHANAILAKLNRTRIKGNKVKVKAA
jgi:ATP-dependent RNA helicase DeaD